MTSPFILVTHGIVLKEHSTKTKNILEKFHNDYFNRNHKIVKWIKMFYTCISSLVFLTVALFEPIVLDRFKEPKPCCQSLFPYPQPFSTLLRCQ